jgi:hypothetical protein
MLGKLDIKSVILYHHPFEMSSFESIEELMRGRGRFYPLRRLRTSFGGWVNFAMKQLAWYRHP